MKHVGRGKEFFKVLKLLLDFPLGYIGSPRDVIFWFLLLAVDSSIYAQINK
jgi:hypothetical protein